MKKCFLFLTSALCTLLFAGAAYADNGCPEGTTALINPQANTRSCIPVEPNAQGTAPVLIERAAVPAPAANYDGQSATPDASDATTDAAEPGDEVPVAEATTDAAEPGDAVPVADTTSDAAEPENEVPVADAAAADSTTAQDATDPLWERMRAAQIAEMKRHQEKERVAQITESVRTSGWVLGGGVGFGYTKSFDVCRMMLHVQAGYHFAIPSSDLLSFGLYLDAFVNFVGLVSGDILVTPNLHISKGRFRFSIALGLGTSIMPKLKSTESDSKNDDDKYSLEGLTGDNTRKDTDAYFTLAPTLGFDWFLSQKAFFGLGVLVPVMIDSDGAITRLKIDFHVGYKF